MAPKRQATPGAVGDFPLYGRLGRLFVGSLARAASRRQEPTVPNVSSSPATGGTVLSATAEEAPHPRTSRQAAPGCWGRGADIQI